MRTTIQALLWTKSHLFTNLSKPFGTNGFLCIYFHLDFLTTTSDLLHQSRGMNQTKPIREMKNIFTLNPEVNGWAPHSFPIFIHCRSQWVSQCKSANLNIFGLLSRNREVNGFQVSSIIFHWKRWIIRKKIQSVLFKLNSIKHQRTSNLIRSGFRLFFRSINRNWRGFMDCENSFISFESFFLWWYKRKSFHGMFIKIYVSIGHRRRYFT